MRKTSSCLVVLGMLVPVLAGAQWKEWKEPRDSGGSGLEVGLRTGYSMAMGDADASMAMSDLTGAQFPIQLDLGFRSGNLTIGGYFSYGFGSVAGFLEEACDADGLSCRTRSLRVGGQILSSLGDPRATVIPWFGVGLGYDSVKVKIGSENLTVSGVEMPVQLGIDFRGGAGSTFGVFGSLSFGRYTEMKSEAQSGSISETEIHEWVTFGVRANFGTP